MFTLDLNSVSKYIIINIVFIWGCNGFDIASEAQIASSGFSFATLKNGKLNINADNTELAFAA